MPHRISSVTATAALLAFAGCLSAADRPVATVAALQAAAAATVAGDTITIAAGTYALTTALVIGVDASADSPIMIRPAPGATVVLDGSAAGTDYAVGLTGSYITFQGIEVDHGGLSLYQGQHITIRDCAVHDAHDSGIWVGKGSRNASGILIERCRVFHCVHLNDGHPAGVTWGQGLSIGLGTQGAIIRGCTVYENQGEGVGAYASNDVQYSDCIAHDNFGADFYLDSATNVIVDRCTAYSLGNATYFRSYVPGDPPHREVVLQMANEDYAAFGWTAKLTNIAVTNCVLMNGYAAFVYGDYSSGGGIDGLRFVNNTCHAGEQELLMIQQPNGSAHHQDCVFRNNIFVQTGGRPMHGVYGGAAAIPAGVSFDHDLWYGGASVGAPGTGDVAADPQLSAPSPSSSAAGDYALTATSPAIDAGSASGAPDHDHAAVARPQGAGIDIGAFEAAAGGATDHAPVAVCAATPTSGSAPLAVVFSTAGSSDADGDSLAFAWAFGDGGTGSGNAPTHTYAAAGVYTATVTVSDGHGGSSTANAAITVTAVVSAAPVITSPDHASATVGSPFQYTITASHAPTAYAASGLPAGWIVDATSGVIAGTPDTAGTLHLTVTATSASGSGTQALDIAVAAATGTGGGGSSGGGSGHGCGHGAIAGLLLAAAGLALRSSGCRRGGRR
jgi:PKD repeat protein